MSVFLTSNVYADVMPLFISTPIFTPMPVFISEQPPAPPEPYTRQWLNRINAQSSDLTAYDEVRKNITYYETMVKDHLNRLRNKEEHRTFYKNYYLKHGLITSLIGLCLLGISTKLCHCFINNELIGSPGLEAMNLFLGIPLSMFSGAVLSALGCLLLKSRIYYDKKLANHKARDLRMLELFQQYKASTTTNA